MKTRIMSNGKAFRVEVSYKDEMPWWVRMISVMYIVNWWYVKKECDTLSKAIIAQKNIIAENMKSREEEDKRKGVWKEVIVPRNKKK